MGGTANEATVAGGVPAALAYNLLRGGLSGMLETGDVLDLGAVTCIMVGSADPTTQGREDAATPLPGQSFFYLAEYDDGHHLSTWVTRILRSLGCRRRVSASSP